VRVIAATNKDLSEIVALDKFREDLFYRLNVFPIQIPPLRDRTGDIALLAAHLMEVASRKLSKTFSGIAPASLASLERYAWPGNVRELQNVIDRAAILSSGPLLEIGDSLDGDRRAAAGTLEEVERGYIAQVLEDTGWTIEGSDGAAKRLGLNPSTLRGRTRKLGLSKSK